MTLLTDVCEEAGWLLITVSAGSFLAGLVLAALAARRGGLSGLGRLALAAQLAAAAALLIAYVRRDDAEPRTIAGVRGVYAPDGNPGTGWLVAGLVLLLVAAVAWVLDGLARNP